MGLGATIYSFGLSNLNQIVKESYLQIRKKSVRHAPCIGVVHLYLAQAPHPPQIILTEDPRTRAYELGLSKLDGRASLASVEPASGTS